MSRLGVIEALVEQVRDLTERVERLEGGRVQVAPTYAPASGSPDDRRVHSNAPCRTCGSTQGVYQREPWDDVQRCRACLGVVG